MQGVPLYAKDQMWDALSNEKSISVVKGCNQPIYLEVFMSSGTQPLLHQVYLEALGCWMKQNEPAIYEPKP